MSRVYNFSAGPAVLPEEVLKEAAAEMLDYNGTGMSVMEMSHRSKAFEEIINSAEQDLRDLMNIPDNYKVLFMQGGASQQFAMIPMNFMKNRVADYIITGQWAKKAAKEAEKYGKVNRIASSEDQTFSYIPDCSDLPVSEDADYVYICENNTIYGTKFKELPNTKGKTLIADVSSCFLSEPVDVEKYGMIYGGVQKNIGPAGVVIAIIREDLITEDVLEGTPTMLTYKTHADAKSLYNTPPAYGIYICGKVFKWLKAQGGLAAIKEKNEKKILKVEVTPESYLEIYYKGELIGYKFSKDSNVVEVKNDKIEIGDELKLNLYKEDGELEEKRVLIEERKKIVFVTFIDKNKNSELDIEDNLITDGEFIIDNKKIEISSSGETEIPGLEIGKKYEVIINSKGRNIVDKKIELKVEEENVFIPVENALFSIDGKVEIDSKPFFEKESEIYENLLLRIKNIERIELFLLPIDKNGRFYIEELPRGEYLYDVEKVGETKIETIEKNKTLIVNNENLTINLKIKGIFFNNY